MATYQEQIEKNRESKSAKAMVAMAELAKIHDALAILEREGILTAYERIGFARLYLAKHPEVAQVVKGA